jgi:pimeloyl-ACP methyl ester carboxylesterase
MQLILIPGFWLDGDSWNRVTPALEAAGHTVHPLTLPGKQSREADRSAITLRDHVDAVAAYLDELPPGVVLVGHSGGGAIAYAVADARPDAVARIVYVDSGPLADGDCINDQLPVVNGEVPLPDWSVFDDESLVDLDDELRDHFRSIAIPEPVHVTSDNQQLSSPRRFDVPSTVICCEMSSDVFRDLIAQGHPYVSELAKATNYELVDLPTGHWPQFTKPAELARLILAAVDEEA